MPHLANVTCWCANAAGTYANPSAGCVTAPCPFPLRCQDMSPYVKSNGTVCSTGAKGQACELCISRYYRYQDTCAPCPKNQNVAVIVGALLGLGLALRLSALVSQVATPQAIALLRSLGNYLQYLSITLGIRLKWPPALLGFFRYLRVLVGSIDLAAPECLTPWSYSKYLSILLGGFAGLMGAAAVAHAYYGAKTRSLALQCRGQYSSKAVHSAFMVTVQIKQTTALIMNFLYVFLTSVLLKAFDCVPGPNGQVLRAFPDTSCASTSHKKMQRLALGLLVTIGPGIPLMYVLYIRRLQRATKLGLSDPRTLVAFGGLYGVYKFRFSTPPLQSPEHNASVEADGNDQPPTRGWRSKFAKSRYRLCVAVAPYYEVLIYFQKFLVVIFSTAPFRTDGARAAGLLATYIASSVLLAAVWPFQRLDVTFRMPLWLPRKPTASWLMPEEWNPSTWRLLPRSGYMCTARVRVTDALNVSCLLTNLIPALNIVVALSANGKGVSAGVDWMFAPCIVSITDAQFSSASCGPAGGFPHRYKLAIYRIHRHNMAGVCNQLARADGRPAPGDGLQ